MITHEQIIVMLLRRLTMNRIITFTADEIEDSFLPIKPIMIERDYETGTLTVSEYAPSAISDHDLEETIKQWIERG